MGTISTYAANKMLDLTFRNTAYTPPVTIYAALLVAGAPHAVTGSAATDFITDTAHGYSNGDLVMLSGLTGGAGLAAGLPYFVVNKTTDTYQLSQLVGGAAMNFTTDLTAGTALRFVEATGGNYARKALAFGAAAARAITNNALVTFDADVTVDYGGVGAYGLYDALTNGNLMAWHDITDKSVLVGDTPSIASGSLAVSVATGVLTTYLVNKWLDHLFRNTAYVPAAPIYDALFTAITAGDAGTVTEVAGGSYARTAITIGSAAALRSISNTGSVVFPTSTADWGTVMGKGQYDAAAAGNLLSYSTPATTAVMTNGDSFVEATSDITITVV